MLISIIVHQRPDDCTAASRRSIYALLITFAAVAALLVVWMCVHEQPANADQVVPLSLRQASAHKPLTFRDRLLVGLDARLKSEVQFVDFVVMLVHNGEVPQRLVDQTFFWARHRAAQPRHGRLRRAILYFRPAMTVRLRHLGIDV